MRTLHLDPDDEIRARLPNGKEIVVTAQGIADLLDVYENAKICVELDADLAPDEFDALEDAITKYQTTCILSEYKPKRGA